jgi:hypothetical protein
MSKLYRVIPTEDGWKIKGLRRKVTFKTKKDAVIIAREAARKDSVPLVVHSKDGIVASVNNVPSSLLSGVSYSLKGKSRFNRKEIRNLVAQVIYERESGKHVK